MNHKHTSFVLLFCMLFVLFCTGCSDPSKSTDTDAAHKGPPRDNTPQVLIPTADGTVLFGNDIISIDASSASSGFLMLQYSGSSDKAKMQLKAPNGVTYTYLISEKEELQTFPFSGGDGTYQISIFECVSAEDDLYALVFSQSIDVSLENEFLPFLYPNEYVNFTSDSAVVGKGSELAADCYSDLEVIQQVYSYVTKNIEYDTEKAQSVVYGYLPDVDDTLFSGKGICFDYAATMAAMLRSQSIPTRLEVGYSSDALHAWISTYVEEFGWIDNIIEFNGETWTLLDPTLAASNSSESVGKYIGDGSHYLLKYSY